MVYAKMFVQIIATLLAGMVAYLTDGSISTNEWLQLAVLAVGAAHVFTGPNVPGARYTKTILSVLAALTAGIIAAITDGISMSEWLVIGIALLGSVGVFAVKNSGSDAVAVNRGI